jgi:hypothetical protein
MTAFDVVGKHGMPMNKILATLLTALMLTVSGIVRAGPYEDGYAAFKRND